VPPADLTIRTHLLHDRDLLRAQVPSQRHAVGAGALDAHPVELAERAHPVEQVAVAGRGRPELLGAQYPPDGGGDGSDVHIEVVSTPPVTTGRASAMVVVCVLWLALAGRAPRRWSHSPGTTA